MTYKEYVNNTSDNAQLARFLVNFCTDFYSETLNGICNVSCETCKHSFYDCVEKLLKQKVDTAKLLRDNKCNAR